VLLGLDGCRARKSRGYTLVLSCTVDGRRGAQSLLGRQRERTGLGGGPEKALCERRSFSNSGGWPANAAMQPSRSRLRVAAVTEDIVWPEGAPNSDTERL
jgi:hypothetical protein